MSPRTVIIAIAVGLSALRAAAHAIAIDVGNPALPCAEAEPRLQSAACLVHVVEDADIGRPRSTWTIPLLESTLAPYDRDALLWRHPLSGHFRYLSQPPKAGIFMHVIGTGCDIRRLGKDAFEIRESGFLFRYVDGVLAVATSDRASWHMEIDPATGDALAELATGAETKQYRFRRDCRGRLQEIRAGGVNALLDYDARGELRALQAGNLAYEFTYRDDLLQTVAHGGAVQTCRWKNVPVKTRAVSFSDLVEIKVPEVTLENSLHVDTP